MTKVEAFAPAKINLSLHVTGKRPDGYHLLDSVACFADIGDSISVVETDRLSLVIDGAFGNQLEADDDNLVLRAARLLAPERGARITLTKRLPVASGIGGGSADAAATLRALSGLWGVGLPSVEECAKLGADVPVCMASGLTRMRGVGEILEPIGPTPDFQILLVNPGVAVPTGWVFSNLSSSSNEGLSPARPATSGHLGLEDLVAWLKTQRNDLQDPAIGLFPEIGSLLDELQNIPNVLHAGMSGSGATCFALFEPACAVDTEGLKSSHPEWWIALGNSYRLGPLAQIT